MVREEFVDWFRCTGGGGEEETEKEKDDQVVLTMKFPLALCGARCIFYEDRKRTKAPQTPRKYIKRPLDLFYW